MRGLFYFRCGWADHDSECQSPRHGCPHCKSDLYSYFLPPQMHMLF